MHLPFPSIVAFAVGNSATNMCGPLLRNGLVDDRASFGIIHTAARFEVDVVADGSLAGRNLTIAALTRISIISGLRHTEGVRCTGTIEC